jgi:hypothetical protein
MSGRTGPVTFGQLSMIRDLHILGADGQADANFVNVTAVPGDVGAAEVTAAWQQLVDRHESLRTTYDVAARDPVQLVQRARTTELELVDIADDALDAVTAVAEQWRARPFSIDVELPWRAFVAVRDGRPRFLVTAVHHVAADYTSCRILDAQFRDLVTGRAVPASPQPIELAARQRAAVAQNKQVIDYWVEEWGRILEGDWFGTDTTERIQAAAYTTAGMRAAQRISARLSISTQAVVLGVAYLVLSRLKGYAPVTFGLIASNRFERRWAGLVSSTNQLAPLTLRARPDMRPDQFLRTVYLGSLEAYSNGSYHVDELRDRLAEQFRQDIDPLDLKCAFNFLEREPEEEEPAGDSAVATTVEWQPAVRQTGPSFRFLAVAGKGMYLIARASRRYLDADSVAAFLCAVESALLDIADGAPPTVAAVNLRPLREVGARPGA